MTVTFDETADFSAKDVNMDDLTPTNKFVEVADEVSTAESSFSGYSLVKPPVVSLNEPTPEQQVAACTLEKENAVGQKVTEVSEKETVSKQIKSQQHVLVQAESRVSANTTAQTEPETTVQAKQLVQADFQVKKPSPILDDLKVIKVLENLDMEEEREVEEMTNVKEQFEYQNKFRGPIYHRDDFDSNPVIYIEI